MAIHFTCDLCSRPIPVDQEVRYEVNIEIKAAFDAQQCECECAREEEGELEEDMQELVALMGELQNGQAQQSIYKLFRFDLCCECRRRYIQDPLFRRAARRLGYNEN